MRRATRLNQSKTCPERAKAGQPPDRHLAPAAARGRKKAYDEFYQQFTYDFEAPLLHAHMVVDAPVQMYALLFIPSHGERGFYLGRRKERLEALRPQGADPGDTTRTCCPSTCPSSRAWSIRRTSRSTSRASLSRPTAS